MKHTLYSLIAVAALALSAATTTSCQDEFTESIFDTHEKSLDQSSYTFPLDTFLVKNYQEPYNIEFIYSMRDVSSDMNYNLVPATYEKAVDFAVLCKYLWMDAYTTVYGKESFLRQYAPRILHLIGSPGYDLSTGTEKLGEAEGGKKITLMKCNFLNPNDIDRLNEDFFKTMHHEFSHILHQNKLYPTDFRTISQGLYNPLGWQETPDSIALTRGFITPYGSKAQAEDWVELLANYVVKDPKTWNKMLSSAKYDWEQVDVTEADSFRLPVANGVSRNIMGYIDTTKRDSITYGDGGAKEAQVKILRRVVKRDPDNRILLNDEQSTPVFIGNGLPFERDSVYKTSTKESEQKIHRLGDDGKGWTFRSVADSTVVEVTDSMVTFTTDKDAIDGPAIIEKKLGMVREWFKDNFSMELDTLRKEVLSREYVTDEAGELLLDEKGRYINRLTADPAKYPTVKAQIEALAEEQSKLFGHQVPVMGSLIEQLRQGVYQYGKK